MLLSLKTQVLSGRNHMVAEESQLQQVLPLLKTHLRAHTHLVVCNVCTHIQINVVYKKQKRSTHLRKSGCGRCENSAQGELAPDLLAGAGAG